MNDAISDKRKVIDGLGNQMADGTYKPAIYFFKNCVHCLRTLPMIGHDKRNPKLPDTNGEDHLMDAICYGLMSRPYAPTKIKPIIRDGYRREESPSALSN